MLKSILILFFSFILVNALEIKQTPINFSAERISLTKEYIKSHYDIDAKDIKITPKIILIHYTGIDDFKDSLARFTSVRLPSDRPDIARGGSVNVSAHFMIERDGTIHQLMPMNFMARHVIGLNYNSIGIENVGGVKHKQNLTSEQLISNIWLIKYLKESFDTIEYVVAHSEYRCFEKTALWLELDDNYRTFKRDPGEIFMKDLRKNLKGFKAAPCD